MITYINKFSLFTVLIVCITNKYFLPGRIRPALFSLSGKQVGEGVMKEAFWPVIIVFVVNKSKRSCTNYSKGFSSIYWQLIRKLFDQVHRSFEYFIIIHSGQICRRACNYIHSMTLLFWIDGMPHSFLSIFDACVRTCTHARVHNIDLI